MNPTRTLITNTLFIVIIALIVALVIIRWSHEISTAATDPATVDSMTTGVGQNDDLVGLQAGLLEAYNCAQQQSGLPVLTLDPELTALAQQFGKQLAADRSLTIATLSRNYPVTVYRVLVLSPDEPASARACKFAGIDARTLPPLTSSAKIGIAVIPGVSAVWPSAIVLAQ
jgi:hypothetical protein